MKKNMKKLALIFLCVLTLGVFAFAFAGCGSAKELTVKVTDPNGKAVADNTVSVQLCATDSEGGIMVCLNPVWVVGGVAKFEIATLKEEAEKAGSTYVFHIQFMQVPDGYGTEGTVTSVNIEKQSSVTVKLVAVA